MSDADDLVLVASFSVSNDDQTPPPLIPLLPQNSQPRDLLPWGHSINSRGGAPPPDTTFLIPNPQPHQLQDLQPGRRHYSNPDYYCQDVAAAADYCPSPPPVRGSSPRSVEEASHPLASPTSKNKKWKTQMCRNGLGCRFASGCHYAHGKEELQKSTLYELKQDHSDANDEYPYLAYPCMHQIMNGECPYRESCKFLHDTRLPFKTGGHHQMRATRESEDLLVDRLYHDLLNFRENPLVQPSMWNMRSGNGDSFDETCNFLANKVDGIHSLFKLPFRVPLGTEKLSTKQKMIIAWKMHQPSPFPEFSSCHSHRDFTFSYSVRPSKYLDGKIAIILQLRTFENDGGVIKEVPNHSHLSYSAGSIIRAYEVVFDVKGTNKCNHSIWFDPTFKSCNKAKQDINEVHTLPYVFMQPVNEEGHHQLLASIMKELIVHNGNFGPKYNDLRKQFNSLKRFHDNLAWPKTKVLPESANTRLKMIADHVNSPYVIDEADNKVKPIWKSFLTNIANLHGDWEGETVTQEAQGRKRLAARGQRSVYFSSSSLPQLMGNENIVDFLADYFPSSSEQNQ